MTAGANMLRAVFHRDGMRRWIVNWPEVGGTSGIARARLGTVDSKWRQLLEELRSYGEVPPLSNRLSHIRSGDLCCRCRPPR